jgi:thiamine-phosphate pyrophosphorylase
VARAIAIPVIAIGGIDVEQVPELLAAGAHGVAVVAAISDAADPAAATIALLRALGMAPP